jgi:hypothetical protein
MNASERPRFLIGEAILRHLMAAPPGPQTVAELMTICSILEARLTLDEVSHVVFNTGWDILGDFEPPETTDQLELPFASAAHCANDDEIPF